ncbi:ABC transporter ATP-binding protein [Riemerella anatipestifer]|uniref:sulfate/molybdate ABC transporter ATP-binding protein n=1 Tax=Riemerella anatipestifer TaxID=34085 RepID=UPI0030BE6F05
MFLEIKNLSFSYHSERSIFTNFNWSFEKGKIIAIAGESGCGKSTLLSLIYGLMDWQEGHIYFEGKPLFGPKANIVPGEKEMKLVAQNYDLMPYGTVYDNVGKFISNINLEEKKNKVNQLLDIVGLSNEIDKKPKFLSGGQQQRVAIARALSLLPKLLLLDEPFSNLDVSRTIDIRKKLFDYVKEQNITLLISTHDLQEVMPWLDEILILKDGQIVQNGTPQELYKKPSNSYVAKLFGEVNILTEQQKEILQCSKNFYYPNEIKESLNGAYTATVLESRFSGGFYWNKIDIMNVELIMYSEEELTAKKISVSLD